MSIDTAFAPHDDEALEDLARAWIAHYGMEHNSLESNATFWVWERMHYLSDHLPHKALRVISLILSMDQSSETARNLRDGAFEDLLRNHGSKIIDLIDAEIMRQPKLQPLLSYPDELNDRRSARFAPGFLEDQFPDSRIDPELLPRDDESDENFARMWIAHQAMERNSPESNATSWTFERMSYLTDWLPNRAWRAITLIWSMDQSITTMQNLSAGPIEDLLSKHGEEMICLVEAEAHRDPSFAKLLGGVWKFRMTDEVWRRLQSVWDRRGWDGIPEA